MNYPTKRLDISEWMFKQPNGGGGGVSIIAADPSNCLYDLMAVGNHFGNGHGGNHAYTST